jgi:hypothetical protein
MRRRGSEPLLIGCWDRLGRPRTVCDGLPDAGYWRTWRGGSSRRRRGLRGTRLGGAGRHPIRSAGAWLARVATDRTGLGGTCSGWIGRAGRSGPSDRRHGRISRGRLGLGADLPRRHRGVYSRGHGRADERRLARHHPCSSGPGNRGSGWRSRALQAGGGLGADALLHLGGTLGGTSGPLPQALDLARLGESQQRQQRDPEQSGEAGNRPHLGEGARQRERKRQHAHGVHTFWAHDITGGGVKLMAPGSL